MTESIVIYQILLQAAKEKVCVSFDYGDHFRKWSPHVIGNSPRGEMVLAYQYGGTSSRGAVPQWKCFEVALITNIKIETNDEWQYAPTKGNTQHCVKTIEYRVINKEN
ncbi:hypothetical protein AA103581_2039 [Gluconobacter wancherniae NBRC 103581]|nr:hypothetical protein AA103581_2039 [Gluconobacter wancherniae NBRC 103581]